MADTTAEPEVLIKRRLPWWRSLWVRIVIVFALMWLIMGSIMWWHSRSAWAVYRVNGVVHLLQEPLHTYANSWLGRYVGEFFVQDRHVRSVQLIYTTVDDQWLVRLRRFPSLENATFDGGQIGPGLENLADLPDLKSIHIVGKQRRVTAGWIDFVDSTISGRHFLLVPQLETLQLNGFKGTISDLDQLKQHPHLHTLWLGDISDLSHVLKQIENCQNIKVLTIQQKEVLDEESVASLSRMSHLQSLAIHKIAKTDATEKLMQSLPKTSVDWRP